MRDYVAEMKTIAEKYKADPEAMHTEADKLLCEILRFHGYGEVVDIFDAMDIWYA